MDKNLEQIVWSYLTIEEIAIKFYKDTEKLHNLIVKYYSTSFYNIKILLQGGFYYTIKYKFKNTVYIPKISDLEILCEVGNLKLVKYFINLGIKLNGQCLENAILGNHLVLTKYILDFDNINITDLSYIMQTIAEDGFLEMYKLLISYNFKASEDDLIASCNYGHFELTKYIISTGVNPTSGLINYAVKNGDWEILKYLVSLNLKIHPTSLTFATLSGDYNIVFYFLKLGIIPTLDALNSAIVKGHLEVIILLLSAGAQIEDKDISIALCLDRLNILRLFKNWGYDFSKDKSLLLECTRVSLNTIKFLINNGIYYDQEMLNTLIKEMMGVEKTDIVRYLQNLNVV